MIIELPFAYEVCATMRGGRKPATFAVIDRLAADVAEISEREAPVAALAFPAKGVVTPFRMSPSGSLMKPLSSVLCDGWPFPDVTAATVSAFLDRIHGDGLAGKRPDAQFLPGYAPVLAGVSLDDVAVRTWVSDNRDVVANSLLTAFAAGAAIVDGKVYVPSEGPYFSVRCVHGLVGPALDAQPGPRDYPVPDGLGSDRASTIQFPASSRENALDFMVACEEHQGRRRDRGLIPVSPDLVWTLGTPMRWDPVRSVLPYLVRTCCTYAGDCRAHLLDRDALRAFADLRDMLQGRLVMIPASAEAAMSDIDRCLFPLQQAAREKNGVTGGGASHLLASSLWRILLATMPAQYRHEQSSAVRP